MEILFSRGHELSCSNIVHVDDILFFLFKGDLQMLAFLEVIEEENQVQQGEWC